MNLSNENNFPTKHCDIKNHLILENTLNNLLFSRTI